MSCVLWLFPLAVLVGAFFLGRFVFRIVRSAHRDARNFLRYGWAPPPPPPPPSRAPPRAAPADDAAVAALDRMRRR